MRKVLTEQNSEADRIMPPVVLISSFTESSDGKPKIFKNTTIDSFYEYFETFKERNIFKDEQLAQLVEHAQAVLGTTSADQVRSNQDIKNNIRAGMVDIEGAMAQALNRPRRKIVMD